MEGLVGSFTALLDAFGVKPLCALCDSLAGDFDSHTLSAKHYNNMYNLMDPTDELGREDFWQETCVVGGRVRYNHLDGELQALRDLAVPVMHATRPEELPLPEQWILIGGAMVVPVEPGADRTKWPNMWSHRHWREKMESALDRVCVAVEVNGARNSCCLLCPDQPFRLWHLLGKSHFTALLACLPETEPVQVDAFRQQWIFENESGALAFNHVDGTLLLLRRAKGSEPVASQQATASTDPHERILAAITVLPQSSPPPPEAVEAAMSSSLPVPMADADTQTVPVVETTGSLPLSTSSFHPPANHPAIGFGDGAFMWSWKRLAVQEVERLEQILKTAWGVSIGSYCKLCQGNIASSDSFADHVARDGRHLEQIRTCFEQKGGGWHGWKQSWPGVARLNHLTLEVSIKQGHDFATGLKQCTASGSGSGVQAASGSGSGVQAASGFVEFEC
jgi:hypothetical protein